MSEKEKDQEKKVEVKKEAPKEKEKLPTLRVSINSEQSPTKEQKNR